MLVKFLGGERRSQAMTSDEGRSPTTTGTSEGSSAEYLRGKWCDLLFVLVISLCLQIAFRLAAGARFAPDNTDNLVWYIPVANNLVSGRGFVGPMGGFAVRAPPGHAMFLASGFAIADAIGVSRALVVDVLVILLTAGSALIVWRLFARACSPAAGLVASVLWSAYPLTLYLSRRPNTEVTYTIVLYLALWAFLSAIRSSKRSRWLAFATGALLGVASLVRAAGVFLAVPVLITIALTRRHSWRLRVVLATLVVSGNVIAVAPWVILVRANTGRVTPLATYQSELMKQGITFGSRYTKDPVRVPRDVRGLMDEAYRDPSVQSSGSVASFIAKSLFRHPLATTKLLALKLGRAFYGMYSGRLELAVLLMQVPFLALGAAGAFRTWSTFPRSRDLIVLILALLGYSVLVTAAVLPLARYLAPTLSLFVALGAPALLQVNWVRSAIGRIALADPDAA